MRPPLVDIHIMAWPLRTRNTRTAFSPPVRLGSSHLCLVISTPAKLTTLLPTASLLKRGQSAVQTLYMWRYLKPGALDTGIHRLRSRLPPGLLSSWSRKPTWRWQIGWHPSGRFGSTKLVSIKTMATRNPNKFL